MKPACIDAVTRAVGRVMSDAEIKGIEDRISREMRGIQDGPDGLRLTGEQRLLEAARRARAGFEADQALKSRREALAVLKHAQIEAALGGFAGDKIAGLRRLLAFHADAKGSVMSVESRAESVEAEAFSRMIGTLEATNPKFFGLLENPEGVRAVVRELFHEDSGSPEAKEGAAQFHKVAEDLRVRFNDAGGKVGKLEAWDLPHHHSQQRIAQAGEAKWTQAIFGRLDRSRYLNEDGSRMDDAGVMGFLKAAYLTLSTGGVNKLEPGAHRGSGMEANSHAEARMIHFKSADDYLAYQKEFGERGLYDVLTGHVRGMADSIAMVETFGPNPDHAFRHFRDLAEREMTIADPTRRGKIAKELVSLDNLFNYVSGKTLPVASERLAQGFDSFRKWLVSSRLGSAFISSLPDEATMQLTARVNNIDGMQMFRNELATLNPANQMEKRMAQRAGLALQTMIGSLSRFGDENLRNTFATKAATFTMRASGLNAITEARRRAFGVTMMSSLGHLSREVDSPSKLDAGDHRILLSKGITEIDWQVWRKAELEDWQSGNDTMLTPDAIYRIPDHVLLDAVPEAAESVRRRIADSTGDLAARNAEETQWIAGRLEKFDQARDALNRSVKDRAAARAGKDQTAAEPLLQRIELLDAQREQAKLQAGIESAFNRMFTQSDAKAFESGLRDAASGLGRATDGALTAAERAGQKFGERRAKLEARMRDAAGRAAQAESTDGQVKALDASVAAALEVDRAALQRDIEIAFKATPEGERGALQAAIDSFGEVKASSRAGLSSAERIGRQYGEQREKLTRRLSDLEKRVAQMDQTSTRAADSDARAAQAKADAMAADLKEFTARSMDRQARRQAVIDRVTSQEAEMVGTELRKLRQDAATRLLGAVLEEQNMAVVEPGGRERAALYSNLQRGTWKGELTRSVFLFKTMPIAMLMRHWERGMSGPDARSRAGYVAALVASTTVMGMAALQIDELLKGRDPVNMNPFQGKAGARNWVRAFLKGGSLGIYGDFLFSEQNQHGGGPVASALGPVIGAAEEAFGLTQGNLVQAIQGKDTHAGAELLKFAKGVTPGANLWYLKAATNHLIFNQLQELVSPGYLSRVKSRAQREFGTTEWWDSREAVPGRAPNMAAAVGGQ